MRMHVRAMCIIRYDVVEGDSVTLLDIYDRNALDVGDGGYIRRHSTDPTQDANLDLSETVSAGTSAPKGNGRHAA